MENVRRKYFAFKLCHFLWYYYFLHIYIERTSPVYFIKDLRNCLKGNNL